MMCSNRKRYKHSWHSINKPNANTSSSKPESVNKAVNSIPIEKYNDAINLFASRSQLRKIIPTTAKLSKYHILESKSTGQDICHKIINTDIGLDECYKDINFDNIIPTLSIVLESFKKQHNKYNYFDKLRYIIETTSIKHAKQKYKYQINMHLLRSFFNLLLYENGALELFGTTKNFKIVKRIIYRLLKTNPKKIFITRTFKKILRKTDATGASLNIKPMLEKLDISKILWLHPITNRIEQWIIVLKLLHWFFAQYIIKILHKYIVLISIKNQWVYIVKDDWCKMQEEFLKEKENIGDLVTPVTLNDSKWNLTIGTYKFIPSTSGLRALLITRYNAIERESIDIVLRFLQQLYVTYFNENGIPTVSSCHEAIFKFKYSTKNQLYYVCCDIQDAFGSIIQEKLYDIIYTCCKQLTTFLVLRLYNLQRNNYYKKDDSKAQTVQFLNLKTSIHTKRATIIKKKPKLVKITKLISKIKKLIFNQKVRIHDNIYLIKSGVPQGMPISPILANIYYQHMFKEIFSVYANNGLLCTYVDDILYITENKRCAAEFLHIIKTGISQYNVKFNPNKIQSNINLPYRFTRIKFLGQYITL